MSEGRVHMSIHGCVAAICIDRPEARNAMTWAMYDQLAEICASIAGNRAIRVATIRGAGGQAFVAGTDIEQFGSFESGEDGIAYEKVIDTRIGQVERLPVPTLAIVDGWAIGGGLAIAAACDFRVATPQASFGVPIARTLGNCLSVANLARVVAAFGVPRAKKMLLLGDTIGAVEALACGFVTALVEPEQLDAKVDELCARLAQNAPVTMRASKEGIRRVVNDSEPQGEDLIRECYGSRDFRIGVQAFLEKKRPAWTGA
jgi:enoyl-CoA hydratase/carnithine racemase